MASVSSPGGYPIEVLAILAHILIEFPAGINFLLRPEYTLSAPSPAARPVIRQYGLLLLVLNGLLTLAVLENFSETSLYLRLTALHGTNSYDGAIRLSKQYMGRMCGILSLYHIGPLVRASSSLMGSIKDQNKVYGGRVVIATLHSILGAALFGAWMLS